MHLIFWATLFSPFIELPRTDCSLKNMYQQIAKMPDCQLNTMTSASSEQNKTRLTIQSEKCPTLDQSEKIIEILLTAFKLNLQNMRLFLPILYLIIALKCIWRQNFRYYIRACVLLDLDVHNQTLDLKWVLHCYISDVAHCDLTSWFIFTLLNFSLMFFCFLSLILLPTLMNSQHHVSLQVSKYERTLQTHDPIVIKDVVIEHLDGRIHNFMRQQAWYTGQSFTVCSVNPLQPCPILKPSC